MYIVFICICPGLHIYMNILNFGANVSVHTCVCLTQVERKRVNYLHTRVFLYLCSRATWNLLVLYRLSKRLIQITFSDSSFHQKTPQISASLSSSSAQCNSRKEPNFNSLSPMRRDKQFDPNTGVDHEHQTPQLNYPKIFGALHHDFFPEKLQEVSNSVCC